MCSGCRRTERKCCCVALLAQLEFACNEMRSFLCLCKRGVRALVQAGMGDSARVTQALDVELVSGGAMDGMSRDEYESHWTRWSEMEYS